MNRAVFFMALACACGGSAEMPEATDPPRAASERPAEPATDPLAPEVPAPAPPADPEPTDAEEVACSVGAVVADPNPAGLNVRSSPGGEVIGQLMLDTEVGLAASRGAWVRLDHAWHMDAEDKEWPLGWVHGSALTTWLKTPQEYGPDTAPVLHTHATRKSPGETIQLDPLPVISVKGCADSYLQAKLTWPDGTVKTGWLELTSHCPSTVTTCP